jgi:hypothetical protein
MWHSSQARTVVVIVRLKEDYVDGPMTRTMILIGHWYVGIYAGKVIFFCVYNNNIQFSIMSFAFN